jgi:N-acetylmuramoyl-L-alanine amidase
MRAQISIYFYCFVFLSNSLYSQENISENLKILIKDTVTARKAINGQYDNLAVEIALTKRYTPIKTGNYPIKIALDPGHTAGTKKEAILEQRYISSKEGFFYESELTMATALHLKKLLTEKGFEVMLTRRQGETALGYSYSYWFRKHFRKELEMDLQTGAITQERFNDLSKATKQEVFHRYFKDKDFTTRINKINAFSPDIAIMIHYNASEFENSPDRFAPEVDYNYSVVFVPGAFTNSELSAQSQMDDFVRLASTNTISKSVQLSKFIVSEFNNKLNAKQLLPNDHPELWYLKKYSTYTGVPGVFGRNLYLTRAPKCPTTYAECFLQNNRDELAKLANRDIKINGKAISSRVIDVADCYYIGIVKYFNENGWQIK